MLKSEQRKIFEKLKNFPDFYLIGGTALALQLGHRISVDFDLASSKKIPNSFYQKVKKIFKEFKITLEIKSPEQLTFLINKSSLTFLYFPFPPIKKLKKFKGVKILSKEEIGADKAYVLGRRAKFRDYVDFYFLIKSGVTLNKIIKLAEKKYKDEFNSRLFLEQLIYLEDVEEEKIYFLKEKVSKKELQNLFEKEIKKIKL